MRYDAPMRRCAGTLRASTIRFAAAVVTVAVVALIGPTTVAAEGAAPTGELGLTHLGVVAAPVLWPGEAVAIARFARDAADDGVRGPHLSWAVSAGGFSALGSAASVAVGVEPVWFHGRGARVSSRLGAGVGVAREFSFGTPPVDFWGVAISLVPVEVLFRVGGAYAGFLLGISAVTDLSRFAATVSLGLSVGVIRDPR